LNLAFSHVILHRLQFTGEFYGETRLNQATPGFASSLWALTYTVVPRLVMMAVFEAGLTSAGRIDTLRGSDLLDSKSLPRMETKAIEQSGQPDKKKSTDQELVIDPAGKLVATPKVLMNGPVTDEWSIEEQGREVAG